MTQWVPIEILEYLGYVVQIFGFPFAIILYWLESKKQRIERRYGTYNAIDDKYIALQMLCLDHPSLDVFDTKKSNPKKLTESEAKQEEAILLIRIAVFERAYLMYRRSTDALRQDQWSGWKMDMLSWEKRENFKTVWKNHKQYSDQKFSAYLEKICPSLAD